MQQTHLCSKLKSNTVVFSTHSQYVFHCVIELWKGIEFAVDEADRRSLKTASYTVYGWRWADSLTWRHVKKWQQFLPTKFQTANSMDNGRGIATSNMFRAIKWQAHIRHSHQTGIRDQLSFHASITTTHCTFWHNNTWILITENNTASRLPSYDMMHIINYKIQSLLISVNKIFLQKKINFNSKCDVTAKIHV